MTSLRGLKAKEGGFTLIELLLVILIISILSGLVIKNLNFAGVQKTTRDAERRSDFKVIQSSLEDYYSDYRIYPPSVDSSWEVVSGSDAMTTSLVSLGYLPTLLLDPTGEGLSSSAGYCTADIYDYFYISDGSYYYMKVLMEDLDNAASSPCTDLSICGVLGGCYAESNP
jgi:prepilin-type N-terminal cleavage/methylation domain-containing protein